MKKGIIYLLPLLLVGCSAKVDKLSYLKVWDDKWQECDKIGKQTILDFPKSEWFESLSLDDKREVFLYIHSLKDYECTKVEASNLKAVLNEVDITTLNEVLKGFIYFDKPSDSRIQHLDQRQVEVLSGEISSPFNALSTAETMGLVEH
ncbi:TPA: hypothetical protein NJ605_004640 [Vibrio parahaemolyticus]|nr:hypothetical protein [Vibrio parahaemolyticus]UJX31143.1 hypothetical protein JHS79_06705 [Vibrio parahaemolyticus]HCG9194275.1 hypothetical protein [Vibrio parahaemolyticus]HCH0835888.1 hypothetical protein [Vibrio parahaemolyticus]HCH0976667.1 hypothetical protein [Vibrio parahaemolyticus]